MPERILGNLFEIKLIVLTILAWAARLAIRSNISFGVMFRQLIISIFIGFMAASYIEVNPSNDWIDYSIFCISIFLADDILAIVVAFGVYAKANQQSVFKSITKFLSGGK